MCSQVAQFFSRLDENTVTIVLSVFASVLDLSLNEAFISNFLPKGCKQSLQFFDGYLHLMTCESISFLDFRVVIMPPSMFQLFCRAETHCVCAASSGPMGIWALIVSIL